MNPSNGIAEIEPVQPALTETAVQQPALTEVQEPEEIKTDISEAAAEEPPAVELEPELAGLTPALIEIPAIGKHAEVIVISKGKNSLAPLFLLLNDL
ncbi:hypothetical protein [Planococcus lenghuensis]|uniref:Uncharacterized protein n=1 Tax=Planococcus lenghuensis TaxID=2213202 RepID=A0A1Q2KYX5_9BACL|nr:hypothetical protein [Planococcus lenghuensis]AQQ53363.1 hypothetical protein B0X71_09935 [Planococcus lenghuensis]